MTPHMLIPRLLAPKILDRLGRGKAILVLGPRQVGKTTLIRDLLQQAGLPYLYLNGDEPDIPQQLSGKTSTELKALIGRHRLVVIDEAQRVRDIGLVLKLFTDQIPDVQVIATGSSALELANETQEPLTGRKFEYHLFPLAYAEWEDHLGIIEAQRLLSHRLVYGFYPEIVTAQGDEEELLKLVASSYLYKDMLRWQDIRKPDLLQRLLQALAFQVGSEVSYHELGQLIGADNQTVSRYLDLLEQSFVIFRLGSFSRNLRNELKRSRKIYFWDNGIRNALISNFNPPQLRQDIGALWENFLVSERMKINHYQGRTVNAYFWRTHAQQEIDYVEERGGYLYAYEMGWNPQGKKRIPATFLSAYPGSTGQVLTRDHFRAFVRGEEMTGG